MRSNPISQVRLKINSTYNFARRKLFFKKKSGRKTSKKRSLNTRGFRHKLSNIKNIIFSRSLLLISTLGLLFLLIININQYFSIRVHSYENETFSPEVINTSNSNVIFIGYAEDDLGYEYINFLYFVNNQGGVLRGFAIDPSFVLKVQGKFVQYNTLLNVFDEKTMESAVTRLEFEFGLRVDRYIAFETSEFEEFLDRKYSSGLAEDFNEALHSEDKAFTITAENQHDFINDIFSSYSSIREKLYYFWQADNLTQVIHTNYSKQGFINFLLNFDSDLKGKLELTPALGIAESNGIYRVNPLLLNEALNGVFRDLRIVSEQCEVEVYNASNRAGLASQKSRELKIAGANVVKSGNYFENIEDDDKKGIVFVSTKEDLERYKNTISLVEQSLRGEIEVRVGEYDYNQTGDLILVLL